MSALHLHMDTCHASVTFPCNSCHRILNTQPDLKLHTQEAHTFHHLGSESSCYICDSTFAKESDVLSHIERDHTIVTRNLVLITMVESLDLKLFPYSSESEENDQLNTLNEEVAVRPRHYVPESVSFECELCVFSTPSTSCLIKHLVSNDDIKKAQTSWCI